MAKLKVHELAKEIGVSSKEIISAAAEKGFSITSAQSGMEQNEVDAIRASLGKKPAEAPKAEAPKAEAPKAEAPKAEAAKAEAPKKKKSNIIIVSNQPQRNGARPAQGQKPQGQNRPGVQMAGGQQNRQQPAKPAPRGPIKPLTPPSDTPSVNMVPEIKNQPKKREEVVVPEVKEAAPAVQAAAAPVQEETAPAAPRENRDNREGRDNRDNRNRFGNNQNGNRPQNAQGGRPAQGQGQYGRREFGGTNGRPQGERGERPQGDRQNGGNQRPYRNNEGGQQGGSRGGYAGGAPGRGFNNNGRSERPNGGQGTSFGGRGGASQGKGFAAPAAPEKGSEKNRDNRRKQSNDRDKRKEINYDEEVENKNRPGRFIKPEKKKEEVVEEVIKVITLPDTISLKDLAEKMKQRPADLIKKLFLAGRMVTLNDELSYEDAETIAMEYEILCEHEVKVDVIEELLKEEDEEEGNLQDRPPVVCVMGHVDHGKTSLLDKIRSANVTSREAGGITQAIGAYTVEIDGRSITFLDTPGHEAFTAMRMRGANSTDIAILVVAADDGVMPQTVEAINHAKAAGVEVIVAVNKIDKPSANIERVKQELSEYELISEDWGGSTVFAPVSAKTGEGIEELLEMILLTSDVLELKANPDRRARGLVIEAELDKGRGPVATILVQKGTLHVGDFVSAGASYGKVRAMINDKGQKVTEATPSMPVEILGLSDVPEAGEVFIAHENDKTAKSFAETYMAQNKEKKLAEIQGRMSLEELFSKIKEGSLKELHLIVKADVQGSVEAVKQSLLKLSNDEVVVKVIHSGVGAINESDVSLASASDAIIIGFNVRPDATAKATAETENVDVRLYNVIYQAIEDVERAMKGMLDPVFEEKVIGHAEVRQIFKASAIGNIAGSYVLDGEIQRGCKVRITREGELIWEGALQSLKRFKDDVKEVKTGFECGLVFDGFDKMQEFDQVEAYIMVEVPR